MAPAGDLVLLNANIRTVDERDSTAEAALVTDGRFAVVGAEEQVRAASATAEVIDVGGRTVIPGMIDAHNHLSIAAFAPDCVDFSVTPVATLAEALTAIENHCQTVPPGRW